MHGCAGSSRSYAVRAPDFDPPVEYQQADATEKLAAEVAELRKAIGWLAAVLDDLRELGVAARGDLEAAKRDAR
jgi:hypothetical protein